MANPNNTIGYAVNIDFPNIPLKVLVQEDGLRWNGIRVIASSKPVIIVQVTPGKTDVYEQPNSLKQPTLFQNRDPIDNTPVGPVYVRLNTRPPQIYNRGNLAKDPDYINELRKGLIGFANKVRMVGVGPDKTEGIDHIKLGWVQDIKPTFKVIYASDAWINGGTASFKPTWNGRPVKGWMLDANRTPDNPLFGQVIGTGGNSAFTNSSTQQEPKPLAGGGQSSIVVSLDAPGIQFLLNQPHTGRQWASTSGGYDFMTYLTAYTTDWDQSYVVYEFVNWNFKLNGKPKADGSWAPLPGTSIVQATAATSVTWPGLPIPEPGDDLPDFKATPPTIQAAAPDVKYDP